MIQKADMKDAHVDRGFRFPLMPEDTISHDTAHIANELAKCHLTVRYAKPREIKL